MGDFWTYCNITIFDSDKKRIGHFLSDYYVLSRNKSQICKSPPSVAASYGVNSHDISLITLGKTFQGTWSFMFVADTLAVVSPPNELAKTIDGIITRMVLHGTCLCMGVSVIHA